MFLEALIVATRVFGSETCTQAAFGAYHDVARRELALAPQEMVISGLSLGFEDKDALPNQLHTPRAALEGFRTFRVD